MRTSRIKAGRTRQTACGLIAVAVVATGCSASSAQEVHPVAAIEGRWVGSARADAEVTGVALSIRAHEDGLSARLDLPDLGVQGWPADSVTRIGPASWRIVIPSDSGAQPMKLSFHGDQLRGTWEMPGWEEPAVVTLRQCGAPPRRAFREEEIRFPGDGIELAGTVRIPRGPGPYAAVVFVHGSGALPRQAYQHEAALLAEMGIASLAYDKRGVGESGGDFRTAGFHDLAGDASAAVTALAPMDGIDASRIGYVGTSQGGWIAPLAATKSAVAFVVVISGPVVPPAREDKWDVVRRLRLAGFDGQAEAEAVHVMRAWDHGLRTGDWDQFLAAREEATSADWYEASRMGNGADFTTNVSEEYARWYRGFIDYDPIPTLRELTMPMLFLYAREDEHIDAVESHAILQREIAERFMNADVVLYNGYDHSIRQLGEDGSRLRWPRRPQGFMDRIAEFIRAAPPCSE